ncbi:MAG: hypothetical protein II117_01015 [Clostridia bacterium]|nr:hypothetical protein [Clostridia bacterium]
MTVETAKTRWYTFIRERDQGGVRHEKTKIIIGAVVALIGIAGMAFAILSLFNGLPENGYHGSIFQAYRPSYRNEGLCILPGLLLGFFGIPVGIAPFSYRITTRD